MISPGVMDMDQERKEIKRRARIFFALEILVVLLIMVILCIFSRWSSWRPALAFSIICLTLFIFNVFLVLRAYSRITK